ncbi:P-loop containing nucleoside triphosphate hydrolase protein [Trametes versicolor FP-101664 SS1]|uniref:P-loop containing nucleoside triphosphate hydrolase protein n=1 Tax=Trametes versicolor (strain FP-101664) TaxID=717944 RepID=UPI00046249E0|nr:P-loop containing nucleoside triphosphate hydrolase protein [Trametes versicolor FP-101664 SS1]EIW62725.1 P-loop containing nucleoside triphosphate hydrolase protein [Trametes versicolor FP-101664 SS1]
MAQASLTSLFTQTGKGLRASSSFTEHASSSKSGHTRKRSEAEDTFPTQVTPLKRQRVTTSARLQSAAPLAERLRPQTLAEFVGQPHLTGPGSLLRSQLDRGATGSIIFWGPPGCGKTTIARLLAKSSNAVFKELSATDSGIADVRAVVEEAKSLLALTGRRTILFLDEVHRFNKAQQDIFLPFLEQGHLQLIGATTENPSFRLTSALLSRCRVFVLERLTDDDIRKIIIQAVERPEPAFAAYPQLTPKVLSTIVSLSTGDARTALSLLELVLSASSASDEEKLLSALRRSVSTAYDRSGDARYDLISALHKSVRGSQGSAALYWLARMLGAGEDPLYIARRMVVCASEDIGLADSHALPLAMSTYQACQVIGMPECRINLAHLVSYLSEAPKSTRAYEGYKRAEEAAKLDMTIPVPLMVRNAPTGLMQNLGYGHGYRYNPEFAHPVTNDYLPIQFRDEEFLLKEGDIHDKAWDEDALREWEFKENGGRPWSGRPADTGASSSNEQHT